MDIFQLILQNIYFKNIIYSIPPGEGTRRTPPRKIPSHQITPW